MRDPRIVPAKETLLAEQCALIFKKLTSRDFFGECTIRVKGGQIYNVSIAQTFTSETLKDLNS